MKLVRTLALFLVLFAFLPFAHAETSPESVAQVAYIVKMSDVIREGKYTGQVVDGVPNGYGLFETANSQGVNWHYLGEWVNGQMKGQGAFYWDDGQAMVGTFENNDMIMGNVYASPSKNYWVDYKQAENGCMKVIEYRSDGSVLYDGCVKVDTGKYHKGTVYTREGKVFFSGEIGEAFSWDLFYFE